MIPSTKAEIVGMLNKDEISTWRLSLALVLSIDVGRYKEEPQLLVGRKYRLYNDVFPHVGPTQYRKRSVLVRLEKWPTSELHSGKEYFECHAIVILSRPMLVLRDSN
jgi:hypothetical protein